MKQCCVPLDLEYSLHLLREALGDSQYTARALNHSRQLLSLYLAGQTSGGLLLTTLWGRTGQCISQGHRIALKVDLVLFYDAHYLLLRLLLCPRLVPSSGVAGTIDHFSPPHCPVRHVILSQPSNRHILHRSFALPPLAFFSICIPLSSSSHCCTI